MKRKFFVLAVLGFSVSGCAGSTEPDPTLTQLLAAPTELAFDGMAFQAEVSAWRDFAPITPPDGQPLAVVVRIGPGFSSVSIERVWVINGGQLWGSTATRVDGTSDWVVRDGPKWGPGVTVEVVMETRHPSFGANLLRRPAVHIGRTS
jgi:hypothetical protein